MIADKQLLEDLDAAERDNGSLQAWFQLKPDQPNGAIPSPEQTKSLAQELVRRAASGSGENPEKVQILDQLGSLRVKAKPNFIRALSSLPGVLNARATSAPYELIRPVKSEPVRLVSARKKSTSRRKATRG